MTRAEIESAYLHRCKAHGHRFLEHWGCFLAEQAQPQKIGFFDIETSNFKADWAITLSYSILDDATDIISGRAIKPKELANGVFDKDLIADMIRDMKQFDVLVGYYSTKFDLPFARTRAVITGNKDFPTFGTLQHKDAYYIVKSKFGALSSRRQENAAKMLLGKTEKTHINPTIWLKALVMHDQASIDFIWDHNNRDVRDLKGIYHMVMPFVKNGTKSI
jgi:uncharacterized protein YprB with RNaseH-like and TPR domain